MAESCLLQVAGNPLRRSLPVRLAGSCGFWAEFAASDEGECGIPDVGAVLLGDGGHDSNWFRAALTEKGIDPCIPSSKSGKVEIPHDKTLYRQRHKIEHMSGRLKDWRRIATRYDRCAHAFFSAICIAATVAFWL